MAVGERFREHVRPGAGELERARGEAAGEFVIAGQVERTLADFAGDNAGGLRAESHAGVLAECRDIGDGKSRAHAVHLADEVIDHAVGFGVAGIETIQLAVGDDVDTG